MEKRVLSLFSGCGGMDLGFEGGFWVPKAMVSPLRRDWIDDEREMNLNQVFLKKNNFRIIFANDINVNARNAWVNYFGKRGTEPKIFQLESIVDLVNKHERGEFSFPKDIDVVIGGFPCQDFSIAGKRQGFKSGKNHLGVLTEEQGEAKRGELYRWMKRVIEITNPKVIVAENVKGLASLGSCREQIENDFCNMGRKGYVVFTKVLYAPHYGIPQRRERLFFIGLNCEYIRPDVRDLLRGSNLRGDPLGLFPPRTHDVGDKEQGLLWDEGYVPCPPLKSILEDLPEPEDSLEDLAQRRYSQVSYCGRGVQGQTEVNLSGLAPTIRAEHHGHIEYRRLSKEHGGKYADEFERGYRERRLTVRECARIQTFPDDYGFIYPKGCAYPLEASASYRLIGNAVPPLLAYHVARNIDKKWAILIANN